MLAHVPVRVTLCIKNYVHVSISGSIILNFYTVLTCRAYHLNRCCKCKKYASWSEMLHHLDIFLFTKSMMTSRVQVLWCPETYCQIAGRRNFYWLGWHTHTIINKILHPKLKYKHISNLKTNAQYLCPLIRLIENSSMFSN